MEDKIINVYSYNSQTAGKAYIYSERKPESHLGYNYFILTKDESDNYYIIEEPSPLESLQINNIKLNKLNKDTEEYQEFISILNNVTNVKKEPVISRR